MCPSACSHHNRIIRNLLSELAEKNLRLNEKAHPHGPAHDARKSCCPIFSAESQRRDSYEFDIPFSRQQLADYLGVERSGLSMELGKMRDEGLLDFHKKPLCFEGVTVLSKQAPQMARSTLYSCLCGI